MIRGYRLYVHVKLETFESKGVVRINFYLWHFLFLERNRYVSEPKRKQFCNDDHHHHVTRIMFKKIEFSFSILSILGSIDACWTCIYITSTLKSKVKIISTNRRFGSPTILGNSDFLIEKVAVWSHKTANFLDGIFFIWVSYSTFAFQKGSWTWFSEAVLLPVTYWLAYGLITRGLRWDLNYQYLW